MKNRRVAQIILPGHNDTTSNGTGTLWSMKYTCTDFNAILTRTDARGVITTYGYGDLDRLTSVAYNTSGAPGVATTPTVNYNYDNNQSSSTKGLLLSVTVERACSKCTNARICNGSLCYVRDGGALSPSVQMRGAIMTGYAPQ